MLEFLLGIDIGTSACKAAVFTLDGEPVAQGAEEYKIYYPSPGWAEQNPDEWWNAVCSVLQKIRRQGICLENIKGIGVDGQSWSAIPVGSNGNVLHNTPIWFDTRAQAFCDALRESIGEKELFECCGNPLQPAYTLPKILWFQKELPQIYENAVRFLQSNSFIVYRLTGRFSQERSQGYGLHCYDVRKGQWDESLCRRLGIDPQKLPDLYDSHEIVGEVTKEAALLTGLCAGTPVVAGGLDAACGALGTGVLHEGETQEQGGQAGGMSICMESCRMDERLILSNHVVPGRWLLQGGTVGGGGVMRWIAGQFGTDARLKAEQNGTGALYELDREAQSVPPGSEGVVFLPYMAGERSPIWNPNAKGVFYGLDYSKTRAHMVRAAMEGVCFSLRHNIETAEAAGVKAGELRAMGGAANSLLWTQMKADVTGKRVLVPASDTATTLGAAMLAGVGVGLYRDFDDAVGKTVKIRRVHNSDREKLKIYQENYEIYRRLYSRLKSVMNKEEK